MKSQTIPRISAWLPGVCGVVACTLTYLAWQRAGLPYNEEGQYFDGLVNYHQQSALAYAVLAFAAWLFALGLVWISLKTRGPAS